MKKWGRNFVPWFRIRTKKKGVFNTSMQTWSHLKVVHQDILTHFPAVWTLWYLCIDLWEKSFIQRSSAFKWWCSWVQFHLIIPNYSHLLLAVLSQHTFRHVFLFFFCVCLAPDWVQWVDSIPFDIRLLLACLNVLGAPLCIRELLHTKVLQFF